MNGCLVLHQIHDKAFLMPTERLVESFPGNGLLFQARSLVGEQLPPECISCNTEVAQLRHECLGRDFQDMLRKSACNQLVHPLVVSLVAAHDQQGFVESA